MKKIIYDRQARDWEEALPIGNGRLGAMVFGRVEEELLQMNEDSIWYGKPVDRNNPDTYRNLGKVRELILSGRQEGRFKGVRLKGNAEVSFSWNEKAVRGKVRADSDWTGMIGCRGMARKVEIKAGEEEDFAFESE